MTGPLAKYRALLAEARLSPDVAQAMAVEKLESLHNALGSYHPSQGASGWFGRFGFGQRTVRRLQWTPGDCESCEPKQGLYICGDVGRGKSMLMDLFFASVPVEAKRRVHFHAFMQEIHGEIHQWRREPVRKDDDNLIVHLARTIVKRSWLLCFDELQVTDIGDAMILGRLFQALFAEGVVVVVTSNRPPDELYKYGLQRDRFMPFIALIKQHLDILELNSEGDYRLGRKKGMQVYYTPLDGSSEDALGHCFDRLTDGKPPLAEQIHVQGRHWTVPRSADGVAWFTFGELCRATLGAADYLALATLYHTVVLSDVPRLSPADRDAAKRFVTLIDALYEHKVTLICSAAVPPQNLYDAGDGAFEFHRTVSRLMEMQSESYLQRQHLT
ncbi:cell division protein ZapE [Telmatospirillum siberiense]|uniref:Cell division protein ZapE n=1 Tax=Telmatospirillum siberiense TaxID=382514 RepID=A0A2N3PYF8_9PROT|nr:cell division protein ZapE [Telmatospirillum siberiense]PKU25428.1 cell division protein ZapE [Telmatospirillum siberiense]